MLEEYAEDLASIRELARRVLEDTAGPEHLKALLDEPGSFDRALWGQAVEQGWPAVSIPADADGLGLSWSGLSVLSEEVGRITASLPLTANALAAHAVLKKNAGAGDDTVAALVSGDKIATLALGDPGDSGLDKSPSARFANGRLSGEKAPAAFAAVADLAIVSAEDGSGVALFLVQLDQPGVSREIVPTYDNSRAVAALTFANADAIRLGGADALADLSSLAALVCAFEQIGGTQASLDMAVAYAKERYAFGQPIGHFQGIKHKLAEMYCLLEIARGCAGDALAAWEYGQDNRHELASAARIGATKAYNYAAQENLHVHGGMGVTWEAMPHHHYRRARMLALEFGSVGYWRERLLGELLAKPAVVE
jgi:alkylation response protein AidB-like acyl-CoA dehydrogenase